MVLLPSRRSMTATEDSSIEDDFILVAGCRGIFYQFMTKKEMANVGSLQM